MPAPKIGEVFDGYSYRGGDPNAKGSWSYVGDQASAQTGMGALNASAPGADFISSTPSAKLSPQDTGALAKYRNAAQSAATTRGDALRFSNLNKQAKTGGIYGAPLIGGLAQDVMSQIDPNVSEMKSISSRLTPAMREPGSGTMSDSDAAMYRAATVSLDKPTQTNQNIAKVIDAGSRRASDYSAFMDEWAKRKGNIVGGQEAWQAYADANPLFKDGGKGGTQINPWTPWRKWFGVDGGGGSAPPAPAASPAQPAKRPPLSSFQR